MKLTVTITGKNDNHAGDFIKRLTTSVYNNISTLRQFLTYEFEYLIIDWGTVQENDNVFTKRLLYEAILNLKEIRFINVRPETIKEKFGHNRFYQFFAKNVGIRHAKGEFVLLINADNILSKSTVIAINKCIKENKFEFYRTRWWEDKEDYKLINRIDCDEKVSESEKGLAPIYSGDFLLCKKEFLINNGRGYDETNIKHQTENPQCSMDGEILYNLRANGIKPVILNETIYHIHHERSGSYDFHYNKDGYINIDNWGFGDKKLNYVNKNVWVI